MTLVYPVEIPENGISLPDAVSLGSGSSYEVPNDGQVWVYLEFTGEPALTISSQEAGDIVALGPGQGQTSPFVMGPYDPYVYGRLLRLNVFVGPVSARFIRLRPLVVTPGQLSERYRGPTGLTGPQGDQGIQGLRGPAGEDGQDGVDGASGGYSVQYEASVSNVGGDTVSLTDIVVPSTGYTYMHVSMRSAGIYGLFGAGNTAYRGYYAAAAVDIATWRGLGTRLHAQRPSQPSQVMPLIHPQAASSSRELGLARGVGDVLGVIWDDNQVRVDRVRVRFS